jgi:multidrug efflux pump subunit AcrA (membrane-fusion protein)
MQRINKKYSVLFLLLMAMACSCHSKAKKEDEEKPPAAEAGTPVTVTAISTEPLQEYTDLSATTSFLQKSYIKANLTGYIQSMAAQPGKFVQSGQVLFTLITKEAKSIGNEVNKLDPSFRFSGITQVKTFTGGYITQLNHQLGDYVQDGEQLAVISDENSFAFILNLPYEQRQYVKTGQQLDVTLPDGTKLKGTVTAALPAVDPGSQTQGMVIKVPNSSRIPENLVAKVRVIKMNKVNAASLPRAAVLTNDVQDRFWVMQMVDSATAVKVPVKKGMETKDRIEILEPQFKARDKILLSGNFGLPDTAKVKVTQ